VSTVGAPARAWTWETALSGVVPPVLSPLNAQREVDEGALRGLCAYILAGGGTGLFVLGGCGEGAWLTGVQRSAVVRGAAKAAEGRAPVLAGVMLPATGPAVEAAKRARDDGADALVAGSPYYFAVDEDAQRRHIERLLEEIELPVLLYNIPPSTHHTLAPELVMTLAQERRVIGIKDSAGDLAAFARFVAVKGTRPDFRVLQGHERVMAESLRLGGDGLVPGLGNVAPGVFAALIRAARSRDDVESGRLQQQIDDLGTLHLEGHWLPALKTACVAVGAIPWEGAYPSLPLERPDATLRAAIEEIVERFS
jgi:dihydrodipicolinate synthase/N-acetylneuraminate lyase